MSPKEILIPLAIFALQMGVIKWIDVKIKFAKSEAEAIAAIKEAGVRLLTLVAAILPGLFVFLEFIKDGPPSKLLVLYLFLLSIGFCIIFTLHWTKEIISIMKEYGGTALKIHSVLAEHNDMLKEHHEILRELALRKN
jgi:hypothetical protein